ncbi:SigE family RNA polymerase sigma factor [Nocardioides bizhenqiangii]|uniref:SigE family RNA polymerase sigma factor n=1 Tax=Nocardioides bizhenqiangii TaxID=3095076 RepID=A0ABZ0ZVX3_9ACTN|nr:MULTISPECIES: SigE family RNA polymerase sigma factor [unclassified Nocardioides]MDZ5621904.1 SigE family RNA polymerase sigma factor [Nocardioides sp. HM23]WQQ27413.1 SigE family RNA polymerase sigma factor [Nocardioides sp. HM61]
MTTDEESFRRWAGERQLALLRTALLLTGDHHRAEDLVQEALAKVALRWRRLSGGNPEAYARQIIVRDNISAWRKRRREVVVAEPGETLTPDITAGVDRRILLDQALATLTPRQRAVVVLRYYDDLTERAAADAMGVSVGTVKSQTSLALRRLREAAPELAELLREES